MSDATFEMLWDCAHCGEKANLGLTHRFCPNCGALQNAEARYFPADSDKVAVAEHHFVGVDRQCSYCQAFTSARANNCGNCGGSLADAGQARTRGDQVSATGFAGDSAADAIAEFAREAVKAASTAPPKRRRWPWLLGGALLAVFVLLGVVCLWKRSAPATVAGHSWTRSVAIETLGPVASSAWCDSLPAGAVNVSRHKEVRSHRKVADGEDCKTRRIDNGDGTFREKEECTPKYRSEPVEDDKCNFTVDQWRETQVEEEKGNSLLPAPTWPEPALTRPGSCVGCQRLGARKETYTVVLDVNGQSHRCDVGQARWAGLAQGATVKVFVRVVGDGVDCDSIR